MKKYILSLAFPLLLTGCLNGEKNKAELALETDFLIGGIPTDPHWGRQKTDQGFEYKKIPISVCIYFVSSIPEMAQQKNVVITVYSSGQYLNPKDDSYGERIAEACAKEPQEISVVLEKANPVQ